LRLVLGVVLEDELVERLPDSFEIELVLLETLNGDVLEVRSVEILINCD